MNSARRRAKHWRRRKRFKISQIQARLEVLFDQSSWRPETDNELQKLFAEIQYLDDIDSEFAKRLKGQISGLREKVRKHFNECQSARREIEGAAGGKSGRRESSSSFQPQGANSWWKKIFGK